MSPDSFVTYLPDRSCVLLLQSADGFFDRVESVNDEILLEEMPATILPSLHADVDHDKWLPKQTGEQEPLCELGIRVEAEVHCHQASTRPAGASALSAALVERRNGRDHGHLFGIGDLGVERKR